MFQSSPGQKAGCNPKARSPRLVICLFQSSPGQKAGCNNDTVVPSFSPVLVSILTRPEGRVQRVVAACRNVHCGCFNPHPARRPGATEDRSCVALGDGVSILTRPEGRVQRKARALPRSSWMFQSSPGQKAGCNPGRRGHGSSSTAFQSSPGQKAGCNAMLHWYRLYAMFQSSPGQKAGCNSATWK